MSKRLISVVTPCYNEEGNVEAVSTRVAAVLAELPEYDYEHLFLDNASTDGTLGVLRRLASRDHRVKVIVNSRNFGPTRSTYNGLLAARGDAAILLAADLQDPPEMIPAFVAKWEEGYQAVFGVRRKRRESWALQNLRKLYYRLLDSMSDIPLHRDAGDFVLLDRVILDQLHQVRIANPYLRGLIATFGFDQIGIDYEMQARTSGRSKASFYRLIVYALNGIIHHTVLPLRLAMLSGIVLAVLSVMTAMLQIVLKLLYPEKALPGLATIIVATFFLSGVQLFLIGLLGEYVGSIHEQITSGPRVIERERINLD